MARGKKPTDTGAPLPPRANMAEELGVIRDRLDQAKAASAADAAKEERAESARNELGKQTAAERRRQAILDQIALDIVEIWTGDDGRAYATILVDRHQENVALDSAEALDWLTGAIDAATGAVPEEADGKAVLRTLRARARKANRYPIYRRVGESDGKIYLDLGDDTWRAIEIDAENWRTVAAPPVKFLRHSSVRTLPHPERTDETIEQALRPFLNVGSDGDFRLICSWLVSVFFPAAPKPLLAISGEQGSGKSLTSRLLRAIVDPNAGPIRAIPADPRDLAVAAENNLVMAFDNLSSIAAWLSDALCRLATGGGFAVREMYTDSGEKVFWAIRPVLLNGIPDLAGRPDLQDRTISIVLPTIPEDQRVSEAEALAKFEAALPRILGALLIGVSAALRGLPRVKLDRLPRMADFAKIAYAAASGFGWSGDEFLADYENSRREGVSLSIESSPFAEAIVALMELPELAGRWSGTSSDLLSRVGIIAAEGVRKSKSWPRSPNEVGAQIRRLGPNLRGVGIEVTAERVGHAGRRIITLTKTPPPAGYAGASFTGAR